MFGTHGEERKLIRLFAILISISLALQGQPGSQSPRGPWLNLSMLLFSQTVCFCPDPPQIFVIPGMTLVSAKAGRLCRGSAVSARSGDGDVRACSRKLHDAWPRMASSCASKHTCLSVYEPVSQWIETAYVTTSLPSVYVKPYLLKRGGIFLSSPRSSSGIGGKRERIAKEWGPGNARA